MHAHDRTMLARLGFADPDRREPLHDQRRSRFERGRVVMKASDSIATLAHVARSLSAWPNVPILWPIATQRDTSRHVAKARPPPGC